MSSELLPLLKDHTFLMSNENCVFKIKLHYETAVDGAAPHISQETAHCEVEDVIRAVMYCLEREKTLDVVQTDHFLIRPSSQHWLLGEKVYFKVDDKDLRCHRNLMLLTISCKEKKLCEEQKGRTEELNRTMLPNKTVQARSSPRLSPRLAQKLTLRLSPKQNPRLSPKQMPKRSTKQVSKLSTKQVSKLSPTQTLRHSPRLSPKKATKFSSKQIPKLSPTKMSRHLPAHAPKQTPRLSPKQTPKLPPRRSPKQAPRVSPRLKRLTAVGRHSLK
ncbi:uncharacterized protein LOC101860384 [Aplysia californica]|uniref:Uncharacterized protein LOC101860384 n=1 Tax=Aplysia californica TaxID=6500 RepID=A0ABM1AEP9_APLCA|nr:uncharacterized protein LOC101860384 [Aplysia californica]